MRTHRATVDSRAEPALRRAWRRAHVRELPHHRPAHSGGRFSGGAQARQHCRRDLHRGAVHRDRAHRRSGHRMTTASRFAIVLVAGLALAASGTLSAQTSTLSKTGVALERVAQARAAKKISERYDPTFRKYTKRFFGPAFDWKYFKAQGFAESGLKADAQSWVGARGVMQLMPSTY